MAKLQLTIAKDYCPNWGLWEGIREVVQNAWDSHDKGKEMLVRHQGSMLRVHNVGVKLDARVWLMGTSSKVGDDSARGHFGEGLKLGVLSLVRAGHEVRIVNDDESWTPKLEKSDVFGEEVLTIYTRQGLSPTGKFSVEIDGVEKAAWEELKDRFLFLVEPNRVENTQGARILLDKGLKGRVFVKGIWVETIPTLNSGYDLKFAKTDRDRRMVDHWDLKRAMGQAWSEVAARDVEILKGHFMNMLTSGAPDVEYAPSYTGDQAKKKLAEEFTATFGEKAMPVLSMAEAKEVGHLGKKGVIVEPGLVALLKDQFDNVAKVREEFQRSVLKVYSPTDISEVEMATWDKAISLTEKAAQSLDYKPVEERATIVDFASATTEGSFQGGKIRIAKKMLADFEALLIVLVHEVAHAAGEDGAASHEEAQMKLMARIVRDLMTT